MATTFQDADDDVQGKPMFLMRPAENVYSYFMFIGPTETKRKAQKSPRQQNEINWDVIMGYILVCMNFFMQCVLLYLIFQEVVVSNIEWQAGILKLGGRGNPMALVSEEAGADGCNDGGSLCFHDGESYSCAPPSVQLTGRWDELDTNKDGVWTREEVEQAEAELKCKYFVDPVEVFDVLINMLKERGNLIWLHPDIISGKAIHLPYFTYVMSDIIMCSYRSEDMCANLVDRGFFHAPLKYGTSPRVGTTIDSAIKYCKALLQPGGTCERNLPSTYAVWKITSGIECGEAEYSQFQYTHPKTGAVKKSLLSVDYAARVEYELAQDVMFRIFKAIIIFTWLLLMVCEYRDVFKVLTFCGRMPDDGEFGEDAVIMEQDPSDPEDVRYRIQAISKHHRMTLILLSVMRVLVTCVLAVVGVTYLIKTNGYADLIMNGVALVFIAEISSVLYAQVLREEVKDQTEDIKAIKVRMYGWEWLNDRPALIDILCVVGIWVAVFIIMQWQMTSVVVPVHNSLECACLSMGEQCLEANKYNYEFWHEYWLNGVPSALTAISQLKAGAPAAAASYAGAPAAAASYLSVASNVTFAEKSQELARMELTKREEQMIEVLTERVAVLEGMAKGKVITERFAVLEGMAKGEASQGSTVFERPDYGAAPAAGRSMNKKSGGQAMAPDERHEVRAARRAR